MAYPGGSGAGADRVERDLPHSRGLLGETRYALLTAMISRRERLIFICRPLKRLGGVAPSSATSRSRPTVAVMRSIEPLVAPVRI